MAEGAKDKASQEMEGTGIVGNATRPGGTAPTVPNGPHPTQIRPWDLSGPSQRIGPEVLGRMLIRSIALVVLVSAVAWAYGWVKGPPLVIGAMVLLTLLTARDRAQCRRAERGRRVAFDGAKLWLGTAGCRDPEDVCLVEAVQGPEGAMFLQISLSRVQRPGRFSIVSLDPDELAPVCEKLREMCRGAVTVEPVGRELDLPCFPGRASDLRFVRRGEVIVIPKCLDLSSPGLTALRNRFMGYARWRLVGGMVLLALSAVGVACGRTGAPKAISALLSDILGGHLARRVGVILFLALVLLLALAGALSVCSAPMPRARWRELSAAIARDRKKEK